MFKKTALFWKDGIPNDDVDVKDVDVDDVDVDNVDVDNDDVDNDDVDDLPRQHCCVRLWGDLDRGNSFVSTDILWQVETLFDIFIVIILCQWVKSGIVFHYP